MIFTRSKFGNFKFYCNVIQNGINFFEVFQCVFDRGSHNLVVLYQMNKRWFAALQRGIGWKPATWQGWSITIIYWVIIVWDFLRVYDISHVWSNIIINFLLESLLL